MITVEARDTNGQLVSNVPLRVEILADGQPVDFGTILGAHARDEQQRAGDGYLHGAVVLAAGLNSDFADWRDPDRCW